ncbi:MAG: hypothetical protein ACFFCE_02110 [Promethearchaeota archaeon]
MTNDNNKKKYTCTKNPSRFKNSQNSSCFDNNLINTQINELQENLSPTNKTIFSKKNMFEFDLIQTLKEFKEKLKNKGDTTFSVKELFNIFQDSLRNNSGLDESEQFNNLYYNLPIKDVKYTACSLIFIGLDLIGKKLKVKELAVRLNLQKDNLSRTKNYYVRLLSELPKYKNLSRPIINYKLTNYENYFDDIIYYINDIKKNLNLEENLIQVDELFINGLNYIQCVNTSEKIKRFYKSAPETKDPKYYSAAFCYLYLRYQNNNNLEQGDFLSIINNFENYQLVEKVFSPIYMYILHNYYYIDQLAFRDKVSDFLDHYILKANRVNYFKSQIKNETKSKALELFDIAIKNGFKVKKDSQSNRYTFPQLIAISLLYFSIKQNKIFEDCVTRDSLKELIGENWDYSTATTNRSPIYSYIIKHIPKIKKHNYSSNDFEELLEQNPSHDTKFLLKIFKNSDLKPLDFVKKLDIYGGDSVANLAKFVKRGSQFTEPKIFKKFDDFIEKNISDHKIELKNDLKRLKSLKVKDFYHQGVKYSFKWNDEQHSINKFNNSLLNCNLYKFFTDIMEGDIIPLNAFNDSSNPRASDYSIQGSNKEPLKAPIINPFIKELQEKGELHIYNQNYALSKIAQKEYKKYQADGFLKPGHKPILTVILNEDENSYAIEVPIWKSVRNNVFLLGHIDLIQFRCNVVYVVDFKPDDYSFFTSLPQVGLYGLMLKEFLQIPDGNIICVSFDKKGAWEYEPHILLTKIKPFVLKLNKSRRTGLLDTSWFDFFS